MATTYTPVTQRIPYGHVLHDCCTQCGATRDAHHTDGRCYTLAEMCARLRHYAATGVWPGPDEGCEESTA